MARQFEIRDLDSVQAKDIVVDLTYFFRPVQVCLILRFNEYQWQVL